MGIHTERVKWANRLLGDRKNIIAVEIGVWKADFSKMMLESNENISCWWGVDPYMPYGRKHRKEDAWDAIYERVVKKMETFGDRFVLVRRTSQSALSVLPRDVDFVFIDGNHDYEWVLHDLSYEQIIKSGGILAGHDFTTPKDGIRRAVNKYITNNHRRLNVDSTFDKSGVYWWQVQH